MMPWLSEATSLKSVKPSFVDIALRISCAASMSALSVVDFFPGRMWKQWNNALSGTTSVGLVSGQK